MDLMNLAMAIVTIALTFKTAPEVGTNMLFSEWLMAYIVTIILGVTSAWNLDTYITHIINLPPA